MKKHEPIPHLFGKIIVFWCVGCATLASMWALRILSHTGHDATGLLGVILAFFGGELLALCLKTVLKKENVSKSDTEGEDDEECFEEADEP